MNQGWRNIRRFAFEAAVGLFIVAAAVVVEICWLAPRLGLA